MDCIAGVINKNKVRTKLFSKQQATADSCVSFLDDAYYAMLDSRWVGQTGICLVSKVLLHSTNQILLAVQPSTLIDALL